MSTRIHRADELLDQSTRIHGGILLAALVQRNVDDAAYTADVLIEFERGSAIRLAKALLALDAAIDASPVIDRRLLDLQASLAATFELAERYAREEE